MKHLIVYCHPNPLSFCRGIMDYITGELLEWGDKVKIRDLYFMEFNPVLTPPDFGNSAEQGFPEDIRDEHEVIRWADSLIFIYPVWWAYMPAELKGYIDRVFSQGFAYGREPDGRIRGLLGDKRVIVINTMGVPFDAYDESGMIEAMKKTVDEGIFRFCGVEDVRHIFFGGVPTSDEERRGRMFRLVHDVLKDFRGGKKAGDEILHL